MKCPNCGSDKVSEGDKYCPDCGKLLLEAPQAVAQFDVTQVVGNANESSAITGASIESITGNVNLAITLIIQSNDPTSRFAEIVKDQLGRAGIDKDVLRKVQSLPMPEKAPSLSKNLTSLYKGLADRGIEANLQTLYDLGMAAAVARDFDTALDYFRQAASADTEYSDAYEGVAFVQQTQAMRDISYQDYDAAQAKLAEAREAGLHVDITDPQAVIIRGYVAKSLAQVAEGKGDQASRDKFYAEAAHLFKQTVKLDPNSAAAQNGLGNVQYALGNFDAAITAYLKAIELQPQYTAAYNDLALAYEEKAKANSAQADEWNRKAIAMWKKVVELAPGDALFWPGYDRAIEQRIEWLTQQQG